jgi:hypothetical protein
MPVARGSLKCSDKNNNGPNFQRVSLFWNFEVFGELCALKKPFEIQELESAIRATTSL